VWKESAGSLCFPHALFAVCFMFVFVLIVLDLDRVASVGRSEDSSVYHCVIIHLLTSLLTNIYVVVGLLYIYITRKETLATCNHKKRTLSEKEGKQRACN
jgi:hypothetical protein